MDLDEVKRLVHEAQWFSRLGYAEARPGFHAVIDAEQWTRHIGASVRAEFNLPGVSDPGRDPLRRMDWLPTSLSQEDPIHGDTLKTCAEAQGKAAEFRSVRLEMHKLAQVSPRGATDHPLLHYGGTDLTLVARGAALFTCRLAASEVVVGVPGFWCSLLPIYGRGNWPLGRIASDEVVIL